MPYLIVRKWSFIYCPVFTFRIEIQDIFLILIICTYWNLLCFLWSMPARKMVCRFICKSKRSTLLYMNECCTVIALISNFFLAQIQISRNVSRFKMRIGGESSRGCTDSRLKSGNADFTSLYLHLFNYYVLMV